MFVLWHNLGDGLRYLAFKLTRNNLTAPAVVFIKRILMKKLNKLAVLLATVAVAGGVMAQSADDNWRDNSGELHWMNGTNELCWRDNFWTPATAGVGCDGALAQAKPVPARPQPVSQKVTYSADAFFDFDKSVLKPQGRATLDKFVNDIRGLNIETIISTGHTDSIGSMAYNQRLSVRRAQAVKNYLVMKGIPANQIVVEGKGETMPVATNKTRAGRAQNRRVEIEVVGSR